MNGYHSKRTRSLRALSAIFGLVGVLLLPRSASAQEALSWARIDFLSNRVQLVPRAADARRASINDVLGIGDALRTARSSRAELRFNDGSLARIGERATFRFTPDTRNFQLNNGTVLLLIPPGRGRSTIQTPNAVTGIQGSALFVRYIPETDTTIVGALTNNPDGPMVLFNRDGTEQQALRANEIGVIEGGQITQIYQFDGALFWQSSGLAEGFNYLTDSPSTGSDALDAVRQEIREAIAGQKPLNGEGVIENPDSFRRPAPDESATPPVTAAPAPATDTQVESGDVEAAAEEVPELDQPDEIDGVEEEISVPEFQGSPAESYLSGSAAEGQPATGRNGNSLTPTVSPEDSEEEEGETPATVRPTETEKFRPSNDVPATPSRQPTGAGGGDSDVTASGSGDEPTNSIDPLRPSALTAPPDGTETEDNPSQGGGETGNVDSGVVGSGTTGGANGSSGGAGAGAGGTNGGVGAGTDTPIVDREVIIPVEDTAPEGSAVVPPPNTAVVVPPPSEAIVVEPPADEGFIAPVSPTEVAPITDELLIDESAAPIISEEMAPPVMPEEMAPPVTSEETTPPEVVEPAPAEGGPSGLLL